MPRPTRACRSFQRERRTTGFIHRMAGRILRKTGSGIGSDRPRGLLWDRGRYIPTTAASARLPSPRSECMYTVWFWVSPDWRRLCAACVVRCARVQGAEASRWVPECDRVRTADFQVHPGGGCPGGDTLTLPVNHYQSGVHLSHPWIPPERPAVPTCARTRPPLVARVCIRLILLYTYILSEAPGY